MAGKELLLPVLNDPEATNPLGNKSWGHAATLPRVTQDIPLIVVPPKLLP